MFDLSNLNDYEFEILCKDIMQDLLDEELFTFSRGVDASVDICDKDFDVSDMRYYLDISDSIRSELKTDYDEDDDRRYSHSESDTSLIVAMFER